MSVSRRKGWVLPTHNPPCPVLYLPMKESRFLRKIYKVRKKSLFSHTISYLFNYTLKNQSFFFQETYHLVIRLDT